MNEQTYHIPALLTPTIDALITNESGVYIDATFGGGGHSRAILSHLSPQGRLFGFDRDIDAAANVPDDPRFTFVHSNFRFIPNFLRFYGVDKVDGILADLGVSFHHFDSAERGFSFRAEEAPLDMRMNQNAPLSAAEVLNCWSEEQLKAMFQDFTDLKQTGRFAKAIVNARAKQEFRTVKNLLDAVKPLISEKSEKKDLAQVFQAIRITVNDEMRALRELLVNAEKVLKPQGRLAILTYHSIEDRIVKRYFKTGNFNGEEQSDLFGNRLSRWMQVGKPFISPSADEIEANPRSRSAKLRVSSFDPRE